MKEKYDPAEPGLQNLPPEIKVIVLKFLDIQSKLALSHTSYGWRDLIINLPDADEITKRLFRLNKKKHHHTTLQIMSRTMTANSAAKLFEELLSLSIPSAYVFLIITHTTPLSLFFDSSEKRGAIFVCAVVIIVLATMLAIADDLVHYLSESDVNAERQYVHRRTFQFFSQSNQSTSQYSTPTDTDSEEEEKDLTPL